MAKSRKDPWKKACDIVATSAAFFADGLKFLIWRKDCNLPKLGGALFAWAVKATGLIDRGYWGFNRLRSKIVLACGSDEFFDAYNRLAYSKQCYDWVDEGLHLFEEQAISRYFPAPPGAVLIGAAGAGREALALARKGYQIVAFEPIRSLAVSLAEVSDGLPIESLVGRYENLPIVSSLSQPSVAIDLRSRAPFSAAILSPGSISHLRSDQDCIATLRHFGELTLGPILASYPPFYGEPRRRFAMNTGLFRTLTSAEIRALAECAGLDILHLDEESRPHWHAVFCRAQPTIKDGSPHRGQ